MPEAYINGRAIRLDPTQFLQSGGEADVYKHGGKAVKLFKPPTHTDLVGRPADQTMAKARIAEHQLKLPAYPKGLPERVITPGELVTNRSGQQIVGYTMNLVTPNEPLMRYADRGWRQTGVDNSDVVEIFRDLHATVEAVHMAGMVIGDFNDLNVLVNNAKAYLIDTDSWQFGRFVCRVFTPRFTDPLLLDRQLQLARPFDINSDWYAYTVMLMQSLLFVEPYGGIFRQPAGSRLPAAQRPLKRITVFHPEVRYPKPAIPYDRLPDELLERFQRIFVRDERGTFPLKLVEELRWTKCRNCGTEHARANCPNCATTPLAAVRAVITKRGTVTATRIFSGKGTILAVAAQSGQLLWLYNHANEFRREDDSLVVQGKPDPHMRYRITGKSTVMAKAGRAIVLTPNKANQTLAVDGFVDLPQLDANAHHHYWISQGQLMHSGRWGVQAIGQVLTNQTLFWVGTTFGFGFYRYGEAYQGFVFDSEEPGINDQVKLPRISGQLIDVAAVFTDTLCWFFWSVQVRSGITNHVIVIRRNGIVEATAEASAGDGSWLGGIRGKCVAGNFVLAATDEGVVRADIAGGTIAQTRSFPDTESYVDSGSQLFVADDGLYAVTRHEITQLKIT